MNSRYLSACAAAFLLWAAAPVDAHAQDGRLSLQVNFGAQSGSGDLTQRLTPTIYDETAAIDIVQGYENGALFDFGGAFAVKGNFLLGVSYSRTGGDGDAAITGQIPDPLFFDRPRSASASAGDLDHVENAVHLQAQYRYAVSPKLDVTVGIGPTIFNASQDLVRDVTVAETAGGPSITPVVADVSESTVGFNIGADGTYMVTDRLGVGVLARWASSSVDLETSGGQTVQVDLGGFQFAAGIRARF